jgi:hypothetical protein
MVKRCSADPVYKTLIELLLSSADRSQLITGDYGKEFAGQERITQ